MFNFSNTRTQSDDRCENYPTSVLMRSIIQGHILVSTMMVKVSKTKNHYETAVCDYWKGQDCHVYQVYGNEQAALDGHLKWCNRMRVSCSMATSFAV